MQKMWALMMILLLTLPGAARAADECPEGSYVAGSVAKPDGGTQYQCKCLPGRVAIGGKCKICGPEEREVIRQQYASALAGMQHSLESLGFEKWRIRYKYGDQAQQNLPHTLFVAATTAFQSPDPAKFPTVLAVLLAEVSLFTTQAQAEIARDPDAQTARQNVETFKATLEKKAEALITCDRPLAMKAADPPVVMRAAE